MRHCGWSCYISPIDRCCGLLRITMPGIPSSPKCSGTFFRREYSCFTVLHVFQSLSFRTHRTQNKARDRERERERLHPISRPAPLLIFVLDALRFVLFLIDAAVRRTAGSAAGSAAERSPAPEGPRPAAPPPSPSTVRTAPSAARPRASSATGGPPLPPPCSSRRPPSVCDVLSCPVIRRQVLSVRGCCPFVALLLSLSVCLPMFLFSSEFAGRQAGLSYIREGGGDDCVNQPSILCPASFNVPTSPHQGQGR